MTVRKLTLEDAPVRAALDFVAASGTPLMAAVLRYMKNQNIALKYDDPDAARPLVSKDAESGQIVITVGMKETTPRSVIAMQVAHGVKQIEQRRFKRDLFSWDRLAVDIEASRSIDNNALKKSYELSPILDALILNLVTRVDAHAFGTMIQREVMHQSVNQVVNVAAHQALLQIDGPIRKSLSQEFRAMNTMLDTLHTVEMLHRIKPAAKIVSLAPVDMTHVCRGLWGVRADLTSPFETNPDVRKDLKRLVADIAASKEGQELRASARALFRLPTNMGKFGRRMLAIKLRPEI